MRILQVTAPADVGGLETVLEQLICGLAPRGHELRTLAFVQQTPGPNSFVARLGVAGHDVTVVPVGNRDYLGERRYTNREIDAFTPDVVHTHGYRADVVDSGVALRRNVAAVSTLHGFTSVGARDRLYEWLQIRALRRVQCVVAVSTPIRERIIDAGVRPARVRVIRNSFGPGGPILDRETARLRLGIGPDEWVVGWVGRLSTEKGPDVMLDAAQLLRQRGISTSFLGDGPMLGSLKRRAVPGLRFHGPVAGAASLLRAFDAVAISSRTEGTPMILLEAVRANVPVVATAVGGIPDVVSDGEAKLVPPGSPGELTAAILELREGAAAAEALAAAASARLERELGFANWLAAYEDAYRAAVAALGKSAV